MEGREHNFKSHLRQRSTKTSGKGRLLFKQKTVIGPT
jgi:hypothetical protein